MDPKSTRVDSAGLNPDLPAPRQGAIVLVLTTIGADADAAALGRTLVEEGLAACVNVLPPMTSIYRWQGAVQHEREQQLLIKTTRLAVPQLEARLRTLHPYELPEFVVLDADASRAYGAWVEESVASREPRR